MVTLLPYAQAGFDQAPPQGARAEKGMGNFSKVLSAADSVAVRESPGLPRERREERAAKRPVRGPPPPRSAGAYEEQRQRR